MQETPGFVQPQRGAFAEADIFSALRCRSTRFRARPAVHRLEVEGWRGGGVEEWRGGGVEGWRGGGIVLILLLWFAIESHWCYPSE